MSKEIRKAPETGDGSSGWSAAGPEMYNRRRFLGGAMLAGLAAVAGGAAAESSAGAAPGERSAPGAAAGGKPLAAGAPVPHDGSRLGPTEGGADPPGGPRLAKVAMGPPFGGLRGQQRAVLFRSLFEYPEQWVQTRSLVGQLLVADWLTQKKFLADSELRRWFAQMHQWGMSLSLEVGAIKPSGQTSQATLHAERPLWDRVLRLGAPLSTLAMDEPLCCCRFAIHKPDRYAVRETADFIAAVRQHYPTILIGDIEPYPSLSLRDHFSWIEALEKRLAELQVRGLDFYRLDVDWMVFLIRQQGSWQEVRKLEDYCHQRHLPFSLIYWAANYPWLQRMNLADNSTWYVEMMSQGYNYAAIGGRPDQLVIESWVGAPSRCVPETADWTFTRSVRDFARKFTRS